MHDNRDISLYVIVICIAAVIAGAGIIIYHPQILGMSITAQGGNITRLDFNPPMQIDYGWAVCYGNFTSSGNIASKSVDYGIYSFNIQKTGKVYDMWAIASLSPVSDIESALPANVTLIDSFLNISDWDPLSGTNTFTDLENITFGNRSLWVWSVRTNSYQGVYRTILLQYNGTLIFATQRVLNGTGFNNQNHEFQLLLPVVGNTTYHFSSYSYSNDTICTIQINLSSRLINYTDVYLHWNAVPGATTYNIYYLDNITNQENTSQILFNVSRATSVSDIHTKNWTDIGVVSNTTQRYYWVGAVYVSKECISDTKAGFIQIPLIRKGTKGLNLVSIPFDLENTSVPNLFKPIYPKLVRVYWYNNVNKGYYPFSVRTNVFGDYIPIDLIGQIRPYGSYWIDVNTNTTLPLTGIVRNSTDINLTKPLNMVGFHMIEGDNRVATVLEPIFPVLNKAYSYDNVNKLYSPFAVRLGAGGIWIPIALFRTFDPAKGYYISVYNNTAVIWP